MATVSLEGMSAEQINDLAALAHQLGTNPNTRLGFQHLVKTANPEVATPELDMRNGLAALANEGEKRLQALDEKIERKRIEDEIKDKRRALIDSGLATKDDLPEIEKLMVEQGIANYESAAKYLSMQRQLTTPTPEPGNPTLSFGDLPKLTSLDPASLNSWARKNAEIALDEIRSGKVTV